MKGITIAATLLCLAGGASYFKTTDDNSKPLALNIALISAAVATTNHLSSKFAENAIKLEAKEREDSLKNEIKTLTITNKKYQSGVDEIKKLYDLQSSKLTETKQALDVYETQIRNIKYEFQSKTKELNLKLQADDTRFSTLVTKFKKSLCEDLKERIDTIYNNLDKSIEHKLTKQLDDGRYEYENIFPSLQSLKDTLAQKFIDHCDWLKEIAAMPTESVVIDAVKIYAQICDEIIALKVRYRNVLNLDVQRSLQDAYETLGGYTKHYTPKQKALEALRELTDDSTNRFENLKIKIDDNDNSLLEMREQVNDLLDQIDSGNLKIAQLNQQVQELCKPITWKISPNQATRAGNMIINWCLAKGIHLDRSHYTGDKYEADLFFFTDRLNAAQTVDIKALNEEGENLAQITHCLDTIKFTYDYDSRLVIAHIVMLHREKATKSVKDFLQPPDKLIQFVRDSYHVGLWGSTGQGKTTAIANIIGGMVEELGGTPTMRTTIPKMDEDTRNIFPHVDWLGVPNSIFGLLECGLEIQYRIHANEQAYLNDEPFPEFDPILFFVDEINLIFSRWRKINDADLEDVLGRFEATLSGVRLGYFTQYMRTELENYKGEFAKRLLLFTWQTGRSLKVKSLISGQNLQPGAFGIMKTDLDNCSYLALGKSAKSCVKYKVNEFESDKIHQQYELIQKELDTKPELKFTALYCPSQGKSFFGQLPTPNYHKWDKDLLGSKKQNQVISFYQNGEPQIWTGYELDVLDNNLDVLDNNLDDMSNDVQKHPTPELPLQKTFKVFGQIGQLPKKFQKLPYEGLVQLWQQLPKKADGSVYKTQAYESVFEVKRSEDRKIVSDFIDYLEAEFW